MLSKKEITHWKGSLRTHSLILAHNEQLQQVVGCRIAVAYYLLWLIGSIMA